MLGQFQFIPKYVILHGWHYVDKDGNLATKGNHDRQEHADEHLMATPHGYSVYLRLEEPNRDIRQPTDLSHEKDFEALGDAENYAEILANRYAVEWFTE